MDYLIIVIVIVTLYLAFGIGSNDETMGSVVGSGTLSLNRAVLYGGTLACLGCIFLSKKVGQNIGSNLFSQQIQDSYSIWMLLAIILGTSTWLVIASKSGAPISTTHSVVGSVIGVAFVWSFIPGNDFLYSLDWSKLGTITLGWIISPIFGLVTAFCIQSLAQYLIEKKWQRNGKIGFREIERSEHTFQYFLIFFISITQFSRGGNDSANAIGIYYSFVESDPPRISQSMSVVLLVMTGLMIALGIILIGRNVIKNVGSSLIEMRPSDALAIESSNALVVFVCTLLGLPISGSHVLIFAIVGSGLAKKQKANWNSLRSMIKAWLVTFPYAGLMSGAFYLVFLLCSLN